MFIQLRSDRFGALLVAAGAGAVAMSLGGSGAVATTGTLTTEHPVSSAISDIPESKDWDAETRAQVARTQFLDPTFSELSHMTGFVDGGYTTRESNTLEVKWIGPLPIEARESIDRAKERGLDTVVVFVKHSEREVLGRATELSAALYAEGIVAWTLAPNDDYSRLDISGPDLERENIDRLAHQIGDPIMGDIPFQIVPWDTTLGDHMNFDARRADTNNFTTAGVIGQTTVGGCTTGLGLNRAGYGDYVVTAGHCADHQNGIDFVTPANRSVGTSGFAGTLWGPTNNMMRTDPVPLDISLIYLGSGGPQAGTTMFVGTATTSTTFAIGGYDSMPYNSTLCSSGGGTGARCFIVRTTSGYDVCVETSGSTCIGHAEVSRVDSSDGTSIMFGGGDSGAPIFKYSLSGGRVIVGFVQGGYTDGAVPCGSTNYYADQPCSVNGGLTTSLMHMLDELPSSFSVSY